MYCHDGHVVLLFSKFIHCSGYTLYNTRLGFELYTGESKRGENLAKEIIMKAEKLGMSKELLSKVSFVTDQGQSIQKALRDAGFQRIPCTAHSTNTVLRHTFKKEFIDEHCPDVASLLSNCKSLVTYVTKSGLVTKLDHTLLQDVKTRFNYKMMHFISVHENLESVKEVLHHECEKEENKNNVYPP